MLLDAAAAGAGRRCGDRAGEQRQRVGGRARANLDALGAGRAPEPGARVPAAAARPRQLQLAALAQLDV